jgi:hypothetical protein
LSGEELKVYFDHRVEGILSKKSLLVGNELEYLLSETGPGNLRIDPELLSHLIKGWSFVYPAQRSVPEIQGFLAKKQAAAICVNENKNSNKIQEILLMVFQNYITGASMASTKPLIFEGKYGDIPIACLVKNGDWVLPNKELFTFLSRSQKNKQFPIIIAKKISGILFPVFKELSVLGLNLYKTYLPKEAEGVILDANSTEGSPTQIKYNDQLQFIDQGFTKDMLTDSAISEPLKNFLENILKNNIRVYFDNFLQTKIEIHDDFLNTISQFRGSKLKKILTTSHENKLSVIVELRKLNS